MVINFRPNIYLKTIFNQLNPKAHLTNVHPSNFAFFYAGPKRKPDINPIQGTTTTDH
jgi:hypothetical protein